MLSKEEVQRGLNTRIVGKKMFVFESIDSTSTCAKALGDAGTEEGAVVVAEHQSQGRGRHGRTWEAEPEKNLLFSILLRPSLEKDSAGLLSFYASVAIARAIESTTGIPVECKWPNDLLINGRKCSGILLENSYQQNVLSYSVVGAGVNVNQIEFPSAFGNRVTSLALECGNEYDRKQILQKILGELDLLYLSVMREDFSRILDEWLRRCRMFGHDVTVRHHNREVRGTAVRLNEDGGLVIQTSGGITTVYAGDVSVVQK
ncbi:MAG: biotin--[acetyl-CoA-carboxylase] ligase [Ignavibacteriales bacterium]|nr:biotin--[acetyl-CoA-carboxylase] ligase [Ignavibacteriales bacterium]